MSHDWAPPVPPRPPGWVPCPRDPQGPQFIPSRTTHESQFQQHTQQSYCQQPYNSQLNSQVPYAQQSTLQQPSSEQPLQIYSEQQYNQQLSQGQCPRSQPCQQIIGQKQQHYLPQARQIWQPVAGTSWQMVLQNPVRLDHTIEAAAVWIVDLFDTPIESVSELHRRGRKVIGYFSGGTYEDWRPDASKFPKSDLGKKLDAWEGEKWVQTSSPAIRQIMIERIELALSKGFDGIDVDNVDGYDNKNGLGLTEDSAVNFIKFVSREAHSRGLACGLKNASHIISRVIDDVQWVVQEQCAQYGDEEEYLPFIRQAKPVFHVEYPKGEDLDSTKCNNTREVNGKALEKCVKAKNMGFSTIIKNIKLDQWVQAV